MERVVSSREPVYLIEKIDGRDYRVRWGIQPLIIEGEPQGVYYMEESVDHLPTIDEVKALIISYYNKLCDEEIVSGFQYEDTPVWLSTENQFNYKAALDLAVQTQGATLPIKFKFGNDAAPVYREFTTLDELKAFYVSAIGYVNEVLQKYWEIKDNIDWKRYEY